MKSILQLIAFTTLAFTYSYGQTPINTCPYPPDGSVAIGATSPVGSEKLRVDGNVHVDDSRYLPNDYSNILSGNPSQRPYGLTTGNGTGKGGILYHYQLNDGPSLKVDLDSHNRTPAIHVSGSSTDDLKMLLN